MPKPMIAIMALLALATSSIVYAQQRGGDGAFEQRHQFTPEDIKAFGDARVAALKAGLQLTPDQDKNWLPLEEALRDLLKLRVDRFQAR